MEHASIAAFARFTLELLSLGAPATLVESSHRALGDETEHARLAFALASAYRGKSIGPGPLNIRGTLDAMHALEIVRCAFVEGCIGETIAAAEAAEALEHATDPAVRDVLTRIVGDERRHSELAWRFVAWALGCENHELRAAARETLTEALNEAARSEPTDALAHPPQTTSETYEREHVFLTHGVLTASLRHEVATAAMNDVIRPCAAALLARPPAARVSPFAAA
jgi:hypothetical protein